MTWLRRMLARWRTRNYYAANHDDCILFFGPCNKCLEYIAARRTDPPVARIHKDKP